MKVNLSCMDCVIRKASASCDKLKTDEDKKLAFMKKVYTLVGGCGKDTTAPYLIKCVNDLMADEFGWRDDFSQIKTQYNQFIRSMTEDLKNKILRSKDPLLAALQYAMAGNLIDFGAMDTVKTEDVTAIIHSADTLSINRKFYQKFCNELKNVKNLVYLLDNAGEIVLDRVFMEQIKKNYPQIHITAVVRGKPVLNDATLRDAEEAGLYDVAEVLDNGTDIPGTQLNRVNRETRQAIENADLILSKGQGNFESLHGCGKNIDYIFLCKCELFVKRFGLKQFSGVFVNERDVNDMQ